MSLLDKYEKKKRAKYKLTDEQKKDRDRKIDEESEKLETRFMIEEEEEEEKKEETEEEREIREKEENNMIEILRKYILDENKEAEYIRRKLNRTPELFQNVGTTFIFDKMKEIFNEKYENQRKIVVQRTNFLL